MIHKGKHLRVYDQFFGTSSGTRSCELFGLSRNVHVTHIDASGMGGRDSAHKISNLMCLRAEAHEFYGDKTEWKEFLREVHDYYMDRQIPWFNVNPMDNRLFPFLKKFPRIMHR